MISSRRLIVIISLLIFAISLLAPVEGQENRVLLVKIDDIITSSTALMIEEAVTFAEDEGYDAIIILLNTHGGQLDATMRIIDIIESSSIPIIAYVYPSGARAWSAGTFILLASHVAAMAPHTIIGSCQPMSYSPFGASEPITDEKIVNAVTAYLVERARMHGRNETAAMLFVTENLNLNDEDALRYGVIEIRASSIEELLSMLDGVDVVTQRGTVKIHTKNAVVDEYGPSLRVSFLKYITNPMIATIAFLVGLYALIYGIAAPGHFAEVVGAILLLLGLLGLGLSIDIVALIFLIIGAIFLIAEAYTPGFGLLGGAGFISIIIGSILLIPFSGGKWFISHDLYSVMLAIVLTASSIVGGFAIFMVYKVVKARKRAPIFKDLIGEVVQVVDELKPGTIGFVKYAGEYWLAKSDEIVKPGERAKVVGKEGHILIVKAERE